MFLSNKQGAVLVILFNMNNDVSRENWSNLYSSRNFIDSIDPVGKRCGVRNYLHRESDYLKFVTLFTKYFKRK